MRNSLNRKVKFSLNAKIVVYSRVCLWSNSYYRETSAISVKNMSTYVSKQENKHSRSGWKGL